MMDVTDKPLAARYRFGVFEADAATGELRRKGIRIKLHSQPFQLLFMLLERPGELLTREEICRELWPGETFVDFEHGVNSAVNRLRDALGDKASNPLFVETLARRGYRFLAPVERIIPEGGATRQDVEVAIGEEAKQSSDVKVGTAFWEGVLASSEDLPKSSPSLVRTLFVMLQLMYLGFYVGALANLAEIGELFGQLQLETWAFVAMIVTAVLLIPVRIFLLCAVAFRAPAMDQKFLRIWPLLLVSDGLWALSPFLLLHHINYGFALACVAPLVYSPFAQRALILMGAGGSDPR